MTNIDSVNKTNSDRLDQFRTFYSEKKSQIQEKVKTVSGQIQKALPQKKPIPDMSEIPTLLKSNSTSAKKYKILYEVVNQSEPNTYAERKMAYDAIEAVFREIEHDDSLKAWVQKADLLDAIDALVKQDASDGLSQDKLQPLKVNPQDYSTKSQPEVSATAVPLIPFSKIEEATAKIANQALNKENLSLSLEGILEQEDSKTAKAVQKMTAQERRLEAVLIFRGFYRVLTRTLGLCYGSHVWFRNSLNQISHVSKDTGIQSIEIITRKSADEKTMEFYYRGPRFLFGKSLHQYRTVNDWFKRDLEEPAREEYLTKAGVDYVISNSNSRVRTHTLQPGEDFGKSRELTGKVLNPEAQEEASHTEKNSAYYRNKYKFNTKNLLGRATNDDMTPKLLAAENIQSLENASKLTKSNKTTILQAQHELLGGMYRVFEREGAHEVIQRLAPADIHNYVAPANGVPLSHLEAAKLLQARVEVKKNAIAEDRGSKEELEKLEAEIKALDQLISVFQKQQQLLGRSSQPTIDIYGTNQSVSTPAIQNQPGILSQNDRKIMLFKHDDGSISMHVFIGATGVNKVDVDPRSGIALKQGGRQGDMQFGRDKYKKAVDEEGREFKASNDKNTRDGLKKLKNQKESLQGQKLGKFPISGSTVISYYLPTEFTFLPQIEAFKESAAYVDGNKKAEIELKTQMGDPLLIKTELALLNTFERLDFELGNQNKIQKLSDHDKKNYEMLLKLREGVNLSASEKSLLKRFSKVLKDRIEARNLEVLDSLDTFAKISPDFDVKALYQVDPKTLSQTDQKNIQLILKFHEKEPSSSFEKALSNTFFEALRDRVDERLQSIEEELTLTDEELKALNKIAGFVPLVK